MREGCDKTVLVIKIREKSAEVLTENYQIKFSA